jgi:hypothetical protein
MDLPGTITRIIRDLEGAERPPRDDTVRELWGRFFADMTVYARRRLRAMHAPLGPADEEDAAARLHESVPRDRARPAQARQPGRLHQGTAVGHRARGIDAYGPSQGRRRPGR